MQAYKNKRKTWLSEEVLNAVGGDPEVVGHVKLSTIEIIKRFFSKFSGDRIAPLFATRRIGTMSMFKFSFISFPLQARSFQAKADDNPQHYWSGSAGQR